MNSCGRWALNQARYASSSPWMAAGASSVEGRPQESIAQFTRLKKLVADQAIDIAILKEVSSGKY